MIRSLILAGAALGLALSVAAPATAQQRAAGAAQASATGTTSPGASFSRPTLPGGGLYDRGAPNNPDRAADLQRRVFTERLTRQVLAEEPPARVQRAYRVSYLIDQGLCGPAAQLARAEHDNRMADQVPVACKLHRYGPEAPRGGVPLGF